MNTIVTIFQLNEWLRFTFNCNWFLKSTRDTPESLPLFVGASEAKKDCTITQMGENVFAAVL